MNHETTPRTVNSEVLEVYRDSIVAARQEGVTINNIIAALYEENVDISRATLYRYLKAWNAQIQRQPLTDDQIQHGVIPLALSTLQSDTKITSNLLGQLGINTSHRQIKRARLKYRTIKRMHNPIER